jgi:hypothetical protein
MERIAMSQEERGRLEWLKRAQDKMIRQRKVACPLAEKACRDGYSALYARAQSLFRDVARARADGGLRNLLARLSRINVLVIDDWARLRYQIPSAATSGRSVRIATRCAPPS